MPRPVTPQTIFATWCKLAFNMAQAPRILQGCIRHYFLAYGLSDGSASAFSFNFVFYFEEVLGCREQHNVRLNF